MKPKLFLLGNFVQGFLEPAAKELGIDLIHPDTDQGGEAVVDFVNSHDEGVIGYMYFASWDDPVLPFIGDIKHRKIFWNLEDPNHFEQFYTRATMADIIFTSASELVSSYQLLFDGIPVYPLTWACEPAMHYPNVEDPYFLNRGFDIVFVGNRYPNEADRQVGETVVLLPALKWARENNKRIGVFGVGDFTPHSWRAIQEVWLDAEGRPAYKEEVEKGRTEGYNGPYQAHTSAFTTGEIYRNSTVVLCMNEQLASPTMTSMRTYEACACANIVLSHYSLATENLFGNLVSISGTKDETVDILEDIFSGPPRADKTGDDSVKEQYIVRAGRAMQRVYESHTYLNRLNFMMEKLYDHFG